MNNIPVTRPYLPSKEKFKKYIDRIYEQQWLTNNGPLVQELELRLEKYLGVKHVIAVANGSLALQVAYKALDLKGEVITTPFSFAATSSTLVWEGLTPVFCDIEPDTYNIDPKLIKLLVTPNTSAILPVHVFGNPCNVESISLIAREKKLNVIYDAAHAFDVLYKGESILNYGDVSTVSFHATKLFHSIEGGAIITKSDELAEKVRKLINFGIVDVDNIHPMGTNAKMNEFEAAMGLCVLDDIESIKSERKEYEDLYQSLLGGFCKTQSKSKDSITNSAYFPVVFESEELATRLKSLLENNGIFSRRYFYPSLDEVYNVSNCENSRILSRRILCLPIYNGLGRDNVIRISNIIIEALS